MNLEAENFIKSYLQDKDLVLEDLQCFFNSNKVSDSRTLLFTTIISEYLQNNSVADLLKIVRNNIKDEESYNLFEKVIKENEVTIKSLNKNVEKSKFSTKKLTDIEWKFVGSASLEQAEQEIYEPRLILKLIFSDSSYQIVESDFGNFKKLQEELELASQSFNSAYSRKIMAFSK